MTTDQEIRFNILYADIHTFLKQQEKYGLSKIRFPTYLKKRVVSFQNETEISVNRLEKMLGLKHRNIQKWEKQISMSGATKGKYKFKREIKMNEEQKELLEEVIKQIADEKNESIKQSVRIAYSVNLQKKVVKLKESLHCTQDWLAEEIGLVSSTISKWCRKYKTNEYVIGQLHGDNVRYDIASKCMVVKRHLEDGVSVAKLADEYQVSQPTISNWKTKYQDMYTEYLDLPEGVMIIGKKEKRVYGLENIKLIIEEKMKHIEKIKQMLIDLSTYNFDSTEVEEAYTETKADIDALNRVQNMSKQ